MKKLKACLAVALFLAVGISAAAQTVTVTVAAAADLEFALQQVAAHYEKASGKPVKLIFGSSGNFFTQIQNGAPFDLFFSADLDYAGKLEAAGLTEPGSLYEYATGKIVLWVPRQSSLDLARGLNVLLDPAIHKIAIANPEHAPYGRAAVAALKHADLYDKVSAKVVMGENISQTATFVVSGSAEIGVIALSLALAPSMKEKGRYFEVASEDYPPIRQAAVVLKSSPQKDAARAFLNFVKSPDAVEVLKTYGFSVPASAGANP